MAVPPFQYPIRWGAARDRIGAVEDRDRALEDFLASLVPEPAVAFPYAAGWADLAGANHLGQYQRWQGHTYLNGAVSRTGAATGAANTLIGTLPENYRPAGTVSFAVRGSNPTPGGGLALVAVESDGDVLYLGALGGSILQTSGFIMLDGIFFPIGG